MSLGVPGAADALVSRLRTRAVLALLVIFGVVVPVLALAGAIDAYALNRLGRYLCFAIVALGIDLIWGYAGVLSLCHAFFFCLGAYAMGMHLSLPGAGGDVRPEYNNIPQFFFFNGVEALPAWWEPFGFLPVAVVVGLVLPAAVAGVVAFVIFRNRVRGVYFSILTQAVAWGAFLAFSRNELLLGGTNGLTNFYKPLNSDPYWIVALYLMTLAALAGAFLACRALVESRAGRVLVAIRDQESRLRFMGYRPDLYKAGAFACAALLAAVGGLLYAPQNGIVTPNVMRVEDSIWMAIWVAVGGRGRLWGAVAGALVANVTYAMLTSDVPRVWPFVQAALFLTVLVYPDGVSQLWIKLEQEVRGGGRVGRALVAFAFLMLFLLVDRMALLPRALSLTEFAGIQSKYWIALVATAGIGWAPVAPTAVPLLAITGVVAGEALGLLPTGARTLKYIVLATAFAWYLARETGFITRVPARPWRVRPAGSSG